MRFPTVCLASLALAACSHAPPKPRPPTIPYACLDGHTPVVRFFPGEERATIRLDDLRAVEMRQLPSGSGAHYRLDDVEFWTKGKSARLSVGGRQTTCDEAR